jgi:hypothetical protein
MKRLSYLVTFICSAVTLSVTPHSTFAQTSATSVGCEQHSNDPLCDLAQRFRPYLKFSRDNGQDEQIRPSSWQWLVKHSDYSTVLATSIGIEPYGDWGPASASTLLSFIDPSGHFPYGSDVRSTAAAHIPSNPSLALIARSEVDPGTNQLAKFGQSWDDVKSGTGDGGSPIYAHVEQLADNPDLINIEYFILFPFNHGINNDICQFGADLASHFTDHYGDLTFLTLVYCKSCDQIIRASFSAHGEVLFAYDLMNDTEQIGGTIQQNATTINSVTLPSLHEISSVNMGDVPAKQVLTSFYYIDEGEWLPNSFALLPNRPFYQTPHENNDSDPDMNNYLFLVQDPITKRYEHVAVYLEWGSHELYPEHGGDAYCCPKHLGDGTSFLPDKVTYLGTLSDLLNGPSYSSNAPFIFWNGKWGNDPQPPLMHRTWYYPTSAWNYTNPCANHAGNSPAFIPDYQYNDVNYFYITSERFVDPSPYNLALLYLPASRTCYNEYTVPWPPVTPPDTAKCNLALKASDPPTTTATIIGPTYSSGGVTYVSGTTVVSFNVTQNPVAANQGAATTYYQINPIGGTHGMGWTVAPPSLAITLAPRTDGAYFVEFYSVDALNNEEAAPHSFQLTLDTTPPLITITQPSAASYPHSDTLTLGYSVSDGQGSGVKSFTPKIDGVTTVSGHGLLSGQTINLLTELSLGTHTFSVDSVDNVNNASSRSVTFSIIVTPDSIKGDVNQFLQAGALKNNGQANSLLAKLDSAAAARIRGQCSAAANVYHAFINELQAQSGKGVTAAAAAVMTDDAQYLTAHCP